MNLSFKNFAGGFFYVVSFYNPQTTCVKAFGVTVLHGITSRKTTVFNNYLAEDFKITLAKISYATEIVLCTKQEQSSQHSRQVACISKTTQFRNSLPWHVTHALSSVVNSTL